MKFHIASGHEPHRQGHGGRLRFTAGANRVEVGLPDPDAGTGNALFERGRPDGDRMQRLVAEWTLMRDGLTDHGIERRGPAVRAELATEEHQSETLGAGDGFEQRAAILALRVAVGNGCTTGWTMEIPGRHAG